MTRMATKRKQKSAADLAKAMVAGPKAKAKAKPKSGYEFRNRRLLKPAQVKKLDAAHQGQFLEAMMMYAGTRYASVDKAMKGVSELQGWTLDEFSIELWDITKAGEETPVYEYWVLGAGDGTVCEAGSDTATAVGSTQHQFQSHAGDDDPEADLVARPGTRTPRRSPTPARRAGTQSYVQNDPIGQQAYFHLLMCDARDERWLAQVFGREVFPNSKRFRGPRAARCSATSPSKHS
jgi:hypothetical protein